MKPLVNSSNEINVWKKIILSQTFWYYDFISILINPIVNNFNQYQHIFLLEFLQEKFQLIGNLVIYIINISPFFLKGKPFEKKVVDIKSQ